MPRLDPDLRFSRGAPRDRRPTLVGMKITHSVLSLALVAGLAGSVAAYRAAAGDVEPAPAPPTAVSAAPAQQLEVPGTKFTWAPCTPGARLEGGTCVVEVVRTVVVPASVTPPPERQVVPAGEYHEDREDADHEEQEEDEGDDD